MKPLVLTESALHTLAAISLSADWFLAPSAIEGVPLHVEETTSGIYVTSSKALPTDRLLVIARSESGLFEAIPDAERRSVFERCMRLGLHGFDSKKVTINPKWMPYHGANRISVFAYGIGHKERIVAELNCKNEGHVFVFAYGDSQKYYNLNGLKPEYSSYDAATAGYLDVDPTRAQRTDEQDGTFELAQLEQTSVTKGLSYSDWYPLRLTLDQRKFVDHDLTGPLRLRGAAGTGKTLAMAVKALKMKYDADASGNPTKILFITHSWAMAEYVDRLIEAMDENPSSLSIIDVFPLLTLAEQRDYAAIGRQPLGIDSDDGKRRALVEISAVVDEFLNGDWAAYKPSCSYDFVVQIESSKGSIDRRLFCWDLLVEFGCVIAAQGILTREDDRERYLRVKRQRWMMPLESAAERQCIFSLWLLFMKRLRAGGFIQTDQIVSDYLNELSTFYWEAAREEQGYDVIFVDETHLFNSQERLVFHHLLRSANIPPKVVMALDPQQSPRETYTSVTLEGQDATGNIFERAKLPKPEKIDLVDVFRYTPQIACVISTVLEAAPGLNPQEDWDVPAGKSSLPDGPKPRYAEVDNALQSFKFAMATALELNKAAKEHGGRVAVLCMDSSKFERFQKAAIGQFKNEAFAIASRDDIEGLRYAGKKVVVSTPEYVAGLQFDTVVLVDANKDQVPEGKYHGFHLRRFLSELYLGMSRAQRDLVIFASKDEGGLSSNLKKAVEGGYLEVHQF